MNIHTVIMNHKSESFSILLHAYVAFTYYRRVQHLDGKICLKSKRDQLFNLVCNLANWIIFCVRQPECIMTSQVSIIISRNHIIVMERFIEKARIFWIIGANHSPCIFVINLCCKRIMFRVYYKTFRVKLTSLFLTIHLDIQLGPR